ncbi:MAG: DUF1592 domain-containing protein [Acidobacteriota bacterium]|nr:DUF1592 domain-containing protein [Acidobacteriota bacterium]
MSDRAPTMAICVALLVGAALPSSAQQSEWTSAQLLRATVSRNCLACHDDRRKMAGLDLSALDYGDLASDAPTLEKVLLKVRAGEMPPAGRPPLDKGLAKRLVGQLAADLDALAARDPQPGAPALHRLNRAEYRNAVRDLLGLELDHARDLPADDSGYGFDNIGDVLTTSPLHIEKYVSAARRVSRLAVGSLAPKAVVEKISRQPGTLGESIDGLPPNLRGGMLFQHHFALAADYVLRVRIGGRRADGLPPPRLDLRVDGRRVRLFDANFSSLEADQETRYFETRVTLAPGSHEVATGFLTEYVRNEGLETASANAFVVDHVLVSGPFDASGPGESESRRRIFVCRPSPGDPERACARRILETLVRRAYRRPATRADIGPLMDLFRRGRADGVGFDAGIEMALSGILVSPSFLFRLEIPPAGVAQGETYRLADLDLATRLAFFLWSSLPDDELLAIAESGHLSEPDVMRHQIGRMLSAPGSRALVENFAGQWLHLRNVADWKPDPERFSAYDDSLAYAFERETELFFTDLIRNDRSVLDLIAGEHSFLNQRLAEFYGVDDVQGGFFRRVSLAGTERAGVLNHASVLMVTSYPTRTSPVLRGKWVLENLLGAPPPPPPPDVPTLADSAQRSPSSLREALEAHRADPACAACHAKLDPLGFALESFDAVGAYRSGEDGVPVETSGALPDGTVVDGPAGLRSVLLDRRDEFVETLAEKLLTYALGRGLKATDRPAVREIRRRVEAADYRFSALVEAIVDSVPFRMRRAPAR